MIFDVSKNFFNFSDNWHLGDVRVLSGLTNTVTAVKNAQMAESPVLLISGAAATLLKVKNTLQFYKSYCKVIGKRNIERLENSQSIVSTV